MVEVAVVATESCRSFQSLLVTPTCVTASFTVGITNPIYAETSIIIIIIILMSSPRMGSTIDRQIKRCQRRVLSSELIYAPKIPSRQTLLDSHGEKRNNRAASSTGLHQNRTRASSGARISSSSGTTSGVPGGGGNHGGPYYAVNDHVLSTGHTTDEDIALARHARNSASGGGDKVYDMRESVMGGTSPDCLFRRSSGGSESGGGSVCGGHSSSSSSQWYSKAEVQSKTRRAVKHLLREGGKSVSGASRSGLGGNTNTNSNTQRNSNTQEEYRSQRPHSAAPTGSRRAGGSRSGSSVISDAVIRKCTKEVVQKIQAMG